MRKLVRRHIFYFILSLVVAVGGTIIFKSFISGSTDITKNTILKIIVLTIIFYAGIELVDLYIWVLKESQLFSYIRRFLAEHIIYTFACIILAGICFIPVIIDYATDTKPYGYYTKEMVKVEGRENCKGNVGQITKDLEIVQTFYSEFSTVTTIDLLIGTYARSNDCTIYVRLVDNETENLLEFWELNALLLDDNSTITLTSKDPLEHFDMMGRVYRLEITSSNDSLEQAATMYYSTEDLYGNGELMINGDIIGGDLIMTISGYEGKDNYERVQIWLCIYLTITVEAVMYYLRRKFDARKRKI